MKILILITALTQSMTPLVVFDFNIKANLKNWTTVNDGVMGGKSLSTFKLNSEGNGVFQGSISLRNNGGFSSVRYNFDKKLIKTFTKIAIKVKGDGKKYQIRIKSNSTDYYSYTANFLTNGEWEEIEIPLANMSPTYRGRALDKPNFSNTYFEQISLFIGNKKEENFKLIVKKLELK